MTPRRWLVGAALGVGCAAEPASDELVSTFRALHTPVYDVFDLGPDRDAVHVALSRAFTGDALTAAYVEHWRALVRMQAESTAVTVTGVEYTSTVGVAPDADGNPRVDASWLVRGVVSHQSHKHARINRYAARYTLVETPDGWRIADTHLRDLARVASRVAVDDLFDDGPGSGAEAGFIDPLELFEAGLLAPAATDTDEATP